jgi:hypothetical protein
MRLIGFVNDAPASARCRRSQTTISASSTMRLR